MAKKTNKTSHVLSLLTNGSDPEETPGQDLAEEKNAEKQEKAETEAAPIESAPPIPPSGDKRVVVVEDQEEDISNKILGDLEKQLESQEVQEPQTMAQEPQSQTVTAAQEPQPQTTAAAAAQEPQPQVTAAAAQESQAQAAVQELQSVSQDLMSKSLSHDQDPQYEIGTQKLQDLTADFGEEECHIENVMENIISRTDLNKYMDQYDVCKCSRCRADVKALILTRLPSKYVVVHKDSVAPMIGFYENKFQVMIFTEILKACLQVKEKPRHGS